MKTIQNFIAEHPDLSDKELQAEIQANFGESEIEKFVKTVMESEVLPVEIFRAGPQISSEGFAHNFTIEDLDQMAATYNAAVHEAPIRIGHSMSDRLPSWGWVQRVYRDGVNLYADVEFVPAMRELIAQKMYKKFSAGLYPPESPINPYPGNWAINHVAILGATPPAVKGLKGVVYSDSQDEGQVLHFEFSEEGQQDEHDPAEAPRQEPVDEEKGPSLIEEQSPEDFIDAYVKTEEDKMKTANHTETEATDVQPTTEVATVEETTTTVTEETTTEPEAQREPETAEFKQAPAGATHDNQATDGTPAVGSDPYDVADTIPSTDEPGNELDAMREERDRAQQALKDMAKRVVDLEKMVMATKREKRQAYAEEVYGDGRITPAIMPKEDFVEFCLQLESATVTFGEGESAKALSPLEVVEKLIASMKPQVQYGESSYEAESTQVDENVSPHDQALAMSKESGRNYAECLKEVLFGVA